MKFKRLETEMARRGWTNDDFAALFEVDNATIDRWFDGEISLHDAQTISWMWDTEPEVLFRENFAEWYLDLCDVI